MPAVIRVSAVYTMSDQVSSKLAKMAAKVTALEKSLDNANGKIDKLGTHAKNAVDPLGDVNKQLNDMKKTVGTAKGSSGLIYRMDQLNGRLKALSGGRDGHKIKVSTSGVKASERDLLALQTKAAALTSGNYKIKLEVDKNTTDLLREQASALERVAGSIKEVKLGFSALKQGEAELRTTMRAKTQAAEHQRKTLGNVERQMTRNEKSMRMFQRAARDGSTETRTLTDHLLQLHKANGQAGTSFIRGTKMGAGFARSIPMIAMVSQLASVAIGGLGVAVHGLIAPVLSAVSSMKDLVGVAALLPAAYGGAAVAVGSFMGALNSFFGDALTNAGKLSEIQKKLDTVTDAEQRKTLMEQQSKLLGEMTTKQQELAKSTSGLMKQWREMFTSNTKLQDSFFRTAQHGIKVASNLIKRYGADIQQTANQVRMLAHHFIDILGNNKDLNAGMKALFRISRGMVATLSKSLEPLMAFFGRVLVASERPMARIEESFAGWADSLDRIDVASIERFITRGIDSAGQWWAILKNLGGAFSNIFRAGQGETQSFLQTLIDITAQFKAWTGGEGFAIIQREFKNGMKVARALGRFVKEFVYQFMLLGADGKVGGSVVEFIDALTGGLPRAFGFMRSSLKKVGPSLTRFLKSFGGFLDLLEASQDGMKIALDALTKVNKIIGYLIKNVPGLKEMVGLLISFKVASLIFGGAFGHMFSLMSGGILTVGGLTDKLKGLKGVMARMTGKGALAANAGWDAVMPASAGGTAMPIPGRGKPTHFGKGLEHLDDPLSARAKKTGAAAGATMLAPVPNMPGKTAKGGKVGKAANALVLTPLTKAFQAIAKVAPRVTGIFTLTARWFMGLSKLARLTIIGTIIMAVVDGLVALATNFAGIRDEMSAWLSVMGGRFKESFSGLTEALGLGALGSEEFKSKMADLALFMKSMGVAVVKVVKVPLSIVLNTLLFIVDAVTSVVNFFKEWVKAGGGFKALLLGLTKLLSEVFNSAFSHLGDILIDIFGSFGAKVTNIFIDIINGINKLVGKIPGVKGADKIDHKINKAGMDPFAKQLAESQIAAGKSKNPNSFKGAQQDIRAQAAQAAGVKVTDPVFIAAMNQMTAAAKIVAQKTPAAPAGAGGAKPGAKGGAGGANLAAMDATLASAATGKSARGVTVAYDPSSVKAFGAQTVLIQKSMKKIQVTPYFVSKPLKVAMDNGTKILVSSGAKMAAAMDKVGEDVNNAVQSWASKVEKALASLGAGSAAAAGGATGTTPASTDAAVKKAGGGFVVPGDSRKGDTVHTLLKPGEVVLNEGQQRKLGKANVNKSLSGPGTAANGTFGFGNMQGAPSSSLNMAGGGNVWGNVPAANPSLIPYIKEGSKYGLYPTATTNHSRLTSSGNVSDHTLGNAVDMGGPIPPMTPYERSLLSGAGGSIKQLLGPAGLYNYGKPFSDGPLQNQHNNHVHVAVGSGAGAPAGFGAPPKVPGRPGFGNSGFGSAVNKRTASMVPGLQSRLDAAAMGGMGGDMGPAPTAGSTRAIGQAMASSMFGWGGSEWTALNELWRRESNWDPTAENKGSGAYGIPQALPASKLPAAGQKSGGSNPAAQIGWGLNYIKNRPDYGSPSAALAHHDRYNWYGRGGEGMVTSPTTIGVGDKKEHVQITPSRTEATPGGAISSASKQGPTRATVTNNFYIGVLTGDEKTMRQLADMVGNTIADQVEGAAQSSVADSVDVMSGNG